MHPENFRSQRAGKIIRHSKGYWAFIPAPLPPNLTWTPALVSRLAETERNLSALNSSGISMPFQLLLARPFTHREAVISSHIEGTRASLVDLYRFEAKQLSFLEIDTDVREVYNYVRAMEYGLERLKTLPISLRLIRELHARLMEGVRGEYLTPGEFRRSQNWIGPAGCTLADATYVPPPIDEMLAGLDQLEKFIHAPSELPVLVRVGIIHYQFEALHPFLDGNGRIGRLLVILLLCAWDLLPRPLLYLSAFFDANRREYYDRLLGVSQHGDWEGWLTFFLQGIHTQSQDAVRRMAHLQEIYIIYQARLLHGRTSRRLLQALEVLFVRPILSVRQMEAALNVPYRTAQRYIEKLVDSGILHEITGQGRNRLYRADEIMGAIEGQM